VHKVVAYIITLCVFGFCPSFEADWCVHCSFRACVFTATSFVLLPSCARHLLSNSVSYSFADRPTCIRYPVNSFAFYGVEYLVYCRFLTFIAMGDRDSKDRDPEESEVSEPTLSEAAVGLADIFGMTVDELRGELRVRSIPYAGLTKVELQMALAYAVGVAKNVSGQATDRSDSSVVDPDPQADTAVDHDPAPPYPGATVQAEPGPSPVKTPSMDEDQLRTLELQIQWRRLEAEKYEHEIQLKRQEIELQLKREERAERERNLQFKERELEMQLQAQQQREREQFQFEL